MKKVVSVSILALMASASFDLMASASGKSLGKTSEAISQSGLSLANMLLLVFFIVGIVFVGAGIMGLVKGRNGGGDSADEWKKIGGGVALSMIIAIVAILSGTAGEETTESTQKQILQGKRYGG